MLHFLLTDNTFLFRMREISSRPCFCATPMHTLGRSPVPLGAPFFSSSVRTPDCLRRRRHGRPEKIPNTNNTPHRRRHRHVTKSIPHGMVLEKKWIRLGEERFHVNSETCWDLDPRGTRGVYDPLGAIRRLVSLAPKGKKRASSSWPCPHG